MKKLAAILLLSFFAAPQAHALNYEDYPTVKLRSLDKITARTMTFEAQVGSTVRFGEIYIKVQACRKPPPVQKTEAAAFLQIWQTDQMQNQSRWIFSGWMFASSPALSAMNHPVYDVWVIDCIGKDPEPVPAPEEQKPEEVKVDAEANSAAPAVTGDQAAPANPATNQPASEDSGEVTPADDPGAFENLGPVPQDNAVNEGDEAAVTSTDTSGTDAAPDSEFNSILDNTVSPDAAATPDPQTPAVDETPPASVPATDPAVPADDPGFKGIY